MVRMFPAAFVHAAPAHCWLHKVGQPNAAHAHSMQRAFLCGLAAGTLQQSLKLHPAKFWEANRIVRMGGATKDAAPPDKVQMPTPFGEHEMGAEGYGAGMTRLEVKPGWAGGKKVFVVPVVNVEVFVPGSGGPSIQPHLQSIPEVANRGWRDYGNRRGLQRLCAMFKELGIPATAVVNSEAAKLEHVAKALKESGWELGAHGLNNSSGAAKLSRTEEEAYFKQTLDDLQQSLGTRPRTWLTPGFSVTERTPEIAVQSGIEAFLDFVDDDVPYYLSHEGGKRTLCLPYCMETNDFSCVLTKHFDGRQYAQAIEDHVCQLAKEEGEKVVCLGMHTFVAGAPARVLALTEALGRLQQVPGVCFATAAQVCAAVQKNP